MPKHIFFVHNPITRILADMVIKKLRLNSDDLAIITYRLSFQTGEHHTYEFPFKHSPNYFYLHRKFWKGRAKLREIDAFINKVSRCDEYLLYIPHMYLPILELMASHPNCIAFSYLEEGKGSFYAFNSQKNNVYAFRDYIFAVLNYGFRLKRRARFFDLNYRNAYKFSEAAFPDFERVIKLNIFNYLSIIDTQARIDGSVLVLDPMVESETTTLGEYLIALENLIFWLLKNKKKSDKVYYKFHPDQILNPDISQKTIKAFFESLTINEIKEFPSFLSLEEVAVNSTATFYGVMSSILYYAPVLGSDAYSFIKMFPQNEKLKDYYLKQPEKFAEKIKFISPADKNQ